MNNVAMDKTTLTFGAGGSAVGSGYSAMLCEFGYKYEDSEHFLAVGQPTKSQGWIIHLSVIISQLHDLLKLVLPALAETPFKIPRDRDTARLLLEGNLGYHQVGKIVTIYPGSDTEAIELAKYLVENTKSFKGPVIPTDVHLGSVVYTRFGGFCPVILTNDAGHKERYRSDEQGALIPDVYTVPFKLPSGTSWIFKGVAKLPQISAKRHLGHFCKPLGVLKADARGSVSKGLYAKGLFRVVDCVIKEGRQYMSSDDNGRDMHDRISWQEKLHRQLQGAVSLPKIYHYFQEDGNDYLVMEYIKGISLYDLSLAVHRHGKGWEDLTVSERMILLNHFIQILQQIQQLHDAGYVHRDITAANFIVKSEHEIILIDIELAYSLVDHEPLPPFGHGTPGYLSPEQGRRKIPTIKEDIYGLCAMLVQLVSRLSPLKFHPDNPDQLAKNLFLFIKDEILCRMMAFGLSPDPEQRPTLVHIRSTLDQYAQRLALSSSKQLSERAVNAPPSQYQIRNTIQSVLNSLTDIRYPMVESLWASKALQPESGMVNEQKGYTVYAGLFEGISGVLHGLSICHQYGFDISPCMNSYEYGLRYLLQRLDLPAEQTPRGFYRGTAGAAVALQSAMGAKLLPNTERFQTALFNCFQGTADGLDLAKGSAGRGVALLVCARSLPDQSLKNLLHLCLAQLLREQKRDGSWLFPGSPRSPSVGYSGFAYGAAGITYFLLDYYRRFPDPDVYQAIIKALSWLFTQTNQLKDLFHDNVRSPLSPVEKISEEDGPVGVIVTFIHAYDVLKDPLYRNAVENALRLYPINCVSNNLAQSGGLAGLGEVYLEAFHYFQQEEWWNRASWIANVLMHTYIPVDKEGCFWLFNDSDTPTADFMTGATGALHFLIRYLNPQNLRYRLVT